MTALILTSIRKTSLIFFNFFKTWNNSSQPIFSLMTAFLLCTKHVCLFSQLIQLEKTLLNCGDEWIYECCPCDTARSVLGWACFGRRLKTGTSTLCSDKVQLLWKRTFSVGLHNLSDELWQEYCQRWRVCSAEWCGSCKKTQELLVTAEFRTGLMALCSLRLWLL